MKATVLVDNIENETCGGEWGLSVYIEHNGKNILLDAGASELFSENAKKMELKLEDVDYAVLSHAHYDHSLGMKKFFEVNKNAPFYIQENCEENCYKVEDEEFVYIGLPEGILGAYPDRIRKVSGKVEIDDGVYLLSHDTPNLDNIGVREKMYQQFDFLYVPDDFSHEQSLVFDMPDGLVVFNSCSHGGPDVIIDEVSRAFGGKNIVGYIGGFHLFNKPDDFVREVASMLREVGIKSIITGHCTGEAAFEILKEELGDIVTQLRTGLVFEF